MAVRNMRVNPNVGVSQSLGFDPRGVLVDNVTQYWLYFPQADQYCPPFTVGWSAPFTLHMAGYGYMEIKTPFGQSTQTSVVAGIGQFVSLTWTDDDVAFSPGIPSSQGSSIDPSLDPGTMSVSPMFTSTDSIYVPFSSGATGPTHGVPINKRARIIGMDVSYNPLVSSMDNAVTVQCFTVSGVVDFGYVLINHAAPHKSLSFGAGIILPIGDSWYAQATSYWRDSLVDITFLAQMVD